jgi:starch phosphorylase
MTKISFAGFRSLTKAIRDTLGWPISPVLAVMLSMACLPLHTELLKQDVLADFYKLSPQKFLNVTNGVTPRRWMRLYNPELSDLISSKIGDGWITDLEDELIKLEAFADDADFQNRWGQIKYQNKAELAAVIKARIGLDVDPHSLFDIQVKRFHEYKRQHLNVLHIISLYNNIKKIRRSI